MANAGVRPTRDDHETAQRWSATARTWFEKVVVRLQWLHGQETGERQWAVGHRASQLLNAVLSDAGRLAPLLDEEQIGEALVKVNDLQALLCRYRLAAKLEETAGRTPAEADAFRAKAASLRGTHA